jgi:hypothetical protein
MAKAGRKIKRSELRKRPDIDMSAPVELTRKTTEQRAEEEITVVPLFSLDGKIYEVPDRVPYIEALRSIETANTRGEAAAVAYQLRLLLGAEGYEILMGFEDLEEDQFTQIVERASEIVMRAKREKDAGGKAE